MKCWFSLWERKAKVPAPYLLWTHQCKDQCRELHSPSSQSGHRYHVAVAALCRAVLPCAETGALWSGAGEVFMLGILREVTSSCFALVLCSSFVSGLDRCRLILFPQALKSHYALLWKVSSSNLNTEETQRHIPQLFLQIWAIALLHRGVLRQMITLEPLFSENWDLQEGVVN